jgi:glycosyltransferase involved in cell wall biosynthesis
MSEVSVVVCAHDAGRWEALQAALASLERQVVQPREVIVVIDHNPGLLKRARTDLPGVRVIENVDVAGLGGARNSGVAASSGSIVAFLDDDAVASSDWLQVLVEEYRDAAVAGAGGSAEPMWEIERPSWFPREFDWVLGCSFLGMPEQAQDVRNLFGCNMSFRRDLLDELGGFRLGYGCDETELCIRIRQRWPEMKLLYTPEAKVFHQVPASRVRVRRFLSRCYFEGGSKAVVTRLVGTGVGLASEYRYTVRVLPAGVLRGLRDFLRGGDLNGLARAAAILVGLTTTTTGYVVGKVLTTRAAKARGWSGELG